jgi:hypothetical protein
MYCTIRLEKGYSMIAEELKMLSKAELFVKWQKIFRKPAPENLTKSYLIKNIAWQVEYGGLSTDVQKKIDKLVEQYSKAKSLKPNYIKRIQKFEVTAGTRFIREFKGKKHEVTALDKGFSYNGKTYKSLSAIANEITGTRWNGKKFFGVV